MGIDWKQIMTMVGPALQQQISQFPPEARVALRETGVYITRDANLIHLDVRFKEEDVNAEKMRGLLLNTMMEAMPQVIKIFGCRVFINQTKGGKSGTDRETAATS